MRTSLAAVAACGGVFALGGAAIEGPTAGLSIAVGAALATGNLWALARVVAGLLPGSAAEADRQSRGAWAVVAALKMGALLAGAWLLMRYAPTVASPLPLLVGFLSMPIGIAIGSLVSDTPAETSR